MPTSEARRLANRANAQHSTGPKTAEGKERSRGNALKHGLTGEGVALPQEDAAEVERRHAAMNVELRPSSELSRALVKRMAMLSVRLDRCVNQDTAALTIRVRQAEADFKPPEGLDAAGVTILLEEARAFAMFDPSKEASLARRYESAAERGLYRALKEFRQIEKDAKAPVDAPEARAKDETMASILQLEKLAKLADMIPAPTARTAPPIAPRATNFVPTGVAPPGADYFELPFAIGKAPRGERSTP
jgi:hypothetical protein